MRRDLLIFVLSVLLPGAAFAAGEPQVDFRNFVYHPSCADFESQEEATVPVRVTEGLFEGKPGTDFEGLYFEVGEILQGDLTGDGRAETVVRTMCSTGGTGRFDEGFVFGTKEGKPVLLGRIPGGDRASGAVRCVRIEQGALKVERLGNDSGAARGIDFVDTETWKIQGGGLAEAGKAVRRRLGPVERAKPIRFARGASSGTVKGTTNGAEDYVLQAREGQTMTVRLTSSPKGAAAFEIMIDDYTVACQGTEWTGELPASGSYRITVVATKGSASYELNVGIR
jgi:hypothetical protein